MNLRSLRLSGGIALPILLLLSCATVPPPLATPQLGKPPEVAVGGRRSVGEIGGGPVGGVSAQRLANLSRGIDLGNVFTSDANPLRYATRINAADIRVIRDAGFTFCRLPITPAMLFDHRNPSVLRPNIRYVDRVVHLIIDGGLSVVIDPIHVPGRDVSFERELSSSPSFVGEIAQYWRAIAARYARLDPNRVFYEIMNEPAASRVAQAPVNWWPPVQERLARVIRAAAPHNTIIATGDEFGGIPGLLLLKPLPMQDVVYSFHFYQPMTFTHQGATWVGPVARVLAGVPYPSSPARVAPLMNSVRLPAARRALYSYGRQRWNAARIRSQIGQAAAWGKRNHVPVFDGEFGVFRTYAPPAARYRWIRDVRSALEHYRIGWAMWNFDAGFNLVRYRYPGVLSGLEVDNRLLAALGLRPVSPTEDGSPIVRFDRGRSDRIVIPVSWLGSLWIEGHGRGAAGLAPAGGTGAARSSGPVARVTHEGSRAWGISPNISFPVSSGQRYSIVSWLAVFGPGSCVLEVVEYGPGGQTMHRDAFTIKAAEHGRWQRLKGDFYIPRGVTRIAFRWVGHGRSTTEVASLELTRRAL